ncbi:MAG TPA: tRNA (guanine(10)-N(2))-dimethyltransferase [Candidatus Nanopelagicaceae bacterium]|nr:tRNA (guanine(10)-N(2))-dimethyltransferase [Candidatus Nanopelagicaceae bacterium]
MKTENQDFGKNKYITKQEGSVKFLLHEIDNDTIPSKSMNVFYNKRMEINRDISILAIIAYSKIINQVSLVVVDSMAASGIGSIRLLKNTKNVEKIYLNDINPVAVELIKNNLELNEIEPKQAEVLNKDANLLFSEISRSFALPDVISIDPFGTPNFYIDSAFKAIKKDKGLLCITATDTAVLFGVKPKACIRKYMAKPLHTDYCKEIGARILMSFISRIANINNLGIIPLLTFYSNHFIRIFAISFRGKSKILKDLPKSYGYIIHCNSCGNRSSIIENLLKVPQKCPICLSEKHLSYSGPLWVGELHQKSYLEELSLLNEKFNFKNKNRIRKILKFALNEINMPISYYNIHKISQQLKLSSIPKLEDIIKIIEEKGYKASRTHFDFISIKTDMKIDELKKVLKQNEKLN